jgi:hypothetical protein
MMDRKETRKRKKRSKRDRVSTKPARQKTAKRTTTKKVKSKVQRADTKGPERSADIDEFEVDKYGTIRSSDFTEPKINRDIFDIISIDRLTTPKNIIEEVEFPYNAIVEQRAMNVKNLCSRTIAIVKSLSK